MRLLVIVGTSAVATGCVAVVHEDAWGHKSLTVWTPGRVTVVESVHVCGPACNHYFYEGRWYELEVGHVHRTGCGHLFWGNRWHFANEVVVHERHVHSANCGHYFHAGKWFWVKEHVHSPGCGHVFLEGRWIIKAG